MKGTYEAIIKVRMETDRVREDFPSKEEIDAGFKEIITDELDGMCEFTIDIESKLEIK